MKKIAALISTETLVKSIAAVIVVVVLATVVADLAIVLFLSISSDSFASVNRSHQCLQLS